MCENKNMKKSEMTISMPLTTWEEYENYKKKYEEITKRLSGCFDDTLYKADNTQSVAFDVQKALCISRDFISYSLQGVDIEIKI